MKDSRIWPIVLLVALVALFLFGLAADRFASALAPVYAEQVQRGIVDTPAERYHLLVDQSSSADVPVGTLAVVLLIVLGVAFVWRIIGTGGLSEITRQRRLTLNAKRRVWQDQNTSQQTWRSGHAPLQLPPGNAADYGWTVENETKE